MSGKPLSRGASLDRDFTATAFSEPIPLFPRFLRRNKGICFDSRPRKLRTQFTVARSAYHKRLNCPSFLMSPGRHSRPAYAKNLPPASFLNAAVLPPKSRCAAFRGSQLPCHRHVLASFASFVLPQAAGLTHFAARPSPRKALRLSRGPHYCVTDAWRFSYLWQNTSSNAYFVP